MDGEEICLCRSRMAFHGFYLVLKKGGRDGTDGSWERLGSFSTNSWDFPRQFLSRVFLPMVTIFHHFSMVIYRYIWLCLDIYIYILVKLAIFSSTYPSVISAFRPGVGFPLYCSAMLSFLQLCVLYWLGNGISVGLFRVRGLRGGWAMGGADGLSWEWGWTSRKRGRLLPQKNMVCIFTGFHEGIMGISCSISWFTMVYMRVLIKNQGAFGTLRDGKNLGHWDGWMG